jgi:hypothetical protein
MLPNRFSAATIWVHAYTKILQFYRPISIYSVYYHSPVNFNFKLFHRMPHSVKHGASKAEDMGRAVNALR